MERLLGAINVLAEALLRIEHKLDVIMRGIGISEGVHPQLHFVGQVCPVCKQQIEYQVDIANQVVKRRCGCTSGKQPPLIPLIPAAGDSPNGNASRRDGGSAELPPGPEDGPRRQGR